MTRRLPVVSDSPLPPLYATWLDELFDGPVAGEPEATCKACAMLTSDTDAPETSRPSVASSFDPQTKCCTYLPTLPNFLVGRILDDRDPAAQRGRATVETRIDQRVAVTPLGLGMPGAYERLYDHAVRTEGFGRTPMLRCPHYLADQGGACGVWKNRNSACATWFCKHERGATGRAFWRRGVRPLLQAVEEALARHCLLELDVGDEALARLVAFDPAKLAAEEPLVLNPEPYRLDWGRWLGRERDFYIECARMVGGLGWSDVLRVGGVAVEARARVARIFEAKRLATSAPQSLRPGVFRVASIDSESARVTTYSSFDPLDVPSVLLAALGRFDGRATLDVLQDISARDDLEIDEATLLRLIDFGILVDAEGEHEATSPAP